MHFASVPFREGLVRLLLAVFAAIGGVGISGCNPGNPSPEAKKSAAPVQANPSPAPTTGMVSNVEVRGDEPLPPNHPPLPSAASSMPGSADSAADIDRRIASQHPLPTGKNKLTVTVPDSVKKKWAAATLAVTANGTEAQHRVAIGDRISLGKNRQLRLVHFLPAYTSDFKTVTSASDEELNPAVQIQLIADGQVISEGWVFGRLPEFNSYKNEQIKVRLISAERTEKQ